VCEFKVVESATASKAYDEKSNPRSYLSFIYPLSVCLLYHPPAGRGWTWLDHARWRLPRRFRHGITLNSRFVIVGHFMTNCDPPISNPGFDFSKWRPRTGDLRDRVVTATELRGVDRMQTRGLAESPYP
jgi:hypothetical protein